MRQKSKHGINNHSPPPKASPTSVRIIGGKWRGRKLPVAEVTGLRPTGNRIRETLFNWLSPYLQDADCLDLFAGSGALGFESLSRGAGKVQFIENNPIACRQLKDNIERLGTNQATVNRANAQAWLKVNAPAWFQTNATDWQQKSNDPSLQHNIIFIDPPFDLDLWQEIVALLHAIKEVPFGTLVYIESPKACVYSVPNTWECLKNKQSGQVEYRLFQIVPS